MLLSVFDKKFKKKKSIIVCKQTTTTTTVAARPNILLQKIKKQNLEEIKKKMFTAEFDRFLDEKTNSNQM